jgi:hypothetical protein
MNSATFYYNKPLTVADSTNPSGSSYALLVGVGKREDDHEHMNVSISDALHVGTALDSLPSFAGMKTEVLTGADATRSNILKRLKAYVENTLQEAADLFIIYFSGHGCKLGDKYYLVCRDTVADALSTTAIDGEAFTDLLKQVQCNKMLVLLDCCHASGMAAEGVNSRSAVPFNEAALETGKKAKNKVIMTACKSEQVSYLSSPVSIFTYALIEGLGGKFLAADEREVNVFNLAMEVRERVIALSNGVLKVKNAQQPELNLVGKSATSNFPIAYYPKGGPQKIRIFEQEFSSLRDYNGKDIDMDVAQEKDDAYREQFNWMVSNVSIQNAGDGGINLKDAHGNVFNIHNGLSDAALHEIISRLDARDNVVARVDAMLKKQEGGGSGDLLAKLDRVSSLRQLETEQWQKQLNLLSQKKGFYEEKKILSNDPGTQFFLSKEIEDIDKEIEKLRNKLG